MSYNPLLEKSPGGEDENAERISFESHPDAPICHSCQRHNRIRRRLSLLSAILIPLLLLVILALLATILSHTSLLKDTITQEHEITHGFYGNDRSYMSLDHKYEGKGAIMVPLRPGEPGTVGLIGMSHQLHCLAGFRKAMQRAREGEEIGIDDNDNGHWPHCLHYMRQAIHCVVDSTIERQRFKNGSSGTDFINGQWDVRTCGSSEKLYALKDKHGA